MFEIHVFGQTKQRDDETLDQFHTHLRHLAKSCEFSDVDKEVKIQLVEYCKFTRVRRKALQEDVSLDEPLKYGRALETSDRQIAQFENKVIPQRSCFFCGSHFSHRKGSNYCPATGKMCGSCGKIGHFAQVCKSTSGISQIPSKSRLSRNFDRQGESDDDKFVFTIDDEPLDKNQPFANIAIGVSHYKFWWTRVHRST